MIMTTLFFVLCIWTPGQDPNYPWTYAGLPEGFTGVHWNGRAFEAFNQNSSLASIYTSDDGLRWTPNRFPQDDFWRFGTNGQYDLGITRQGAVYHRDDDGQWLKRGEVPLETAWQLLWDGGRWLLLGEEALFASENGAQWEQILAFGENRVINMAVRDGLTGIATFEGYITLDDQGLQTQEQLLLRNIAVQNDQFFGIGLFDNCLYQSPDGKTWQCVFNPSKGILLDFLWADNVYVAVGDEGLLASSADGLSWNEHDGAGNESLMDVTWYQGRFLVPGETLWASTDGTNWSAADWEGLDNLTPNAQLIPSQESLLVISGDRRNHWIVRDEVISEAPSGGILGLEVLNQTILLATDQGLFRSTDGLTWQRVEAANLLLTRTEERFVAFGPDNMLTSTDGLSWDVQPGLQVERKVIWEHDRFFMFGHNRQNRFSFDGLTWEPLPDTFDPADVAWTGDRFILAGHAGLWHSADGLTWELTPNSPADKITRILAEPDQILLGSESGLFSSSDGGLHWVRRQAGKIRALDKGRDHYLAMSEDQVFASPDGRTWQRQPILAPHGVYALDVWNDQLLAWDAQGLAFADWALGSEPGPARPQAVIPWVVANEIWYSQIAIFNQDASTSEVRLLATDREGTTAEETLQIPPRAVWSGNAAALFPGLNGYSIQIHTPSDVYASYITFNNGEGGNQAPAQTVAAEVPTLTQNLSFGYVPGEDVPAVVLVNTQIEAGEIEVTFSLVGQSGLELGTETRTLSGNQPLAIVVSELFEMELPEHAAVHVTGPPESRLAGTTFVFNSLGQPAMSRAHIIYLPGWICPTTSNRPDLTPLPAPPGRNDRPGGPGQRSYGQTGKSLLAGNLAFHRQRAPFRKASGFNLDLNRVVEPEPG